MPWFQIKSLQEKNSAELQKLEKAQASEMAQKQGSLLFFFGKWSDCSGTSRPRCGQSFVYSCSPFSFTSIFIDLFVFLCFLVPIPVPPQANLGERWRSSMEGLNEETRALVCDEFTSFSGLLLFIFPFEFSFSFLRMKKRLESRRKHLIWPLELLRFLLFLMKMSVASLLLHLVLVSSSFPVLVQVENIQHSEEYWQKTFLVVSNRFSQFLSFSPIRTVFLFPFRINWILFRCFFSSFRVSCYVNIVLRSFSAWGAEGRVEPLEEGRKQFLHRLCFIHSFILLSFFFILSSVSLLAFSFTVRLPCLLSAFFLHFLFFPFFAPSSRGFLLAPLIFLPLSCFLLFCLFVSFCSSTWLYSAVCVQV